MVRAALLVLAACGSSSSTPAPAPTPTPAPVSTAPAPAPVFDAAPIDAAPIDADLDPRCCHTPRPSTDPPEPTPPGRLKIASAETLTPGSKLADAVVADKISSAYFPQLRRCYRKALAGDHMMRGMLVLTLDIAPAGTTRAHETRFVDDGVARCAAAVAASWRFPSPGATAASFVVHVVMLPE